MADAKAGNGNGSGSGNGNGNDDDGDCGSATRAAESPARTIDSHDSTTGSLATIVDRSLSHGEGAPSGADRSPTASQRTINDGRGRTEVKEQPQSLASDAQSHIYSSPVYVVHSDAKPLLKSGGAALPVANGDGPRNGDVADDDDIKKPKIISHEEFQKQLQLAAVSRAATIDSRISKKQRLPPELIRIKDGHDGSCLAKLQPEQWKAMQKGSAASLFPLQLALGSIQLLLAISLVALGSLLLVREGSLARAGCGIWTGLFAAITGALGVVSMRKTQTAFLALSLVCIATSALALAISGVGLSRDINHMPEQFDLAKANDKISASAGLIFTLFLHFLVSLVSVYRCAINMCARSQHRDLSEVFIKANNNLTLDPKWIGNNSKPMSLPSGEKQDNSEKFVTMWMYTGPIKNGPLAPSVRKMTPPSKPLVLIPASSGCNTLLPTQTLLPTASTTTSLLMPPLARGRLYRARTFSQLRPGSMVSMSTSHPGANSLLGTYRTCKSTRSADINSQRRRRRAAAGSCDRSSRATKTGRGHRQRRKSATDVVDGKAFVYTGLDRVIADSFLARQEQTQTGSHVDYSSSSSASEQCNGGQAPPPI